MTPSFTVTGVHVLLAAHCMYLAQLTPEPGALAGAKLTACRQRHVGQGTFDPTEEVRLGAGSYWQPKGEHHGGQNR
jgi:hypothetical protein